ncbi:MAG: hypothetical protein ACXVIS_10815 [Halobacteriota archaeon]
MVLTESQRMQARESLHRRTEARNVYDRSKLEVDVAKLAIAVIAELVIFFLWFHFPIRERYEVLAHVVLPVCIVFPFLNYRYLILVPFIAFIPDIARAFGFDIAHSLISLPIAFLVGFLPFVKRPRTAILAGYTVLAIIASHLIVDTRKYATIENVAGYPWADLVLYTLLLTVIGFVLLEALRFTEKTAEGQLR